MTSAETRKLLAYIWARALAPYCCGERDSAIRSIVLGRRLLRAPCRRREPISSSSNRPTILMMPLTSGVSPPSPPRLEVVFDEAMRASIAEKAHNLSSMRPAKMNSLSRPPSWAGWVSKSSNSQFTIEPSEDIS